MSQNQIPMVPPQPVPTMVAITNDPNHKVVVVHVSTPAGMGVYFMDPDFAEQTGKNLLDHARQARSNIVVPGVGVGKLNGNKDKGSL